MSESKPDHGHEEDDARLKILYSYQYLPTSSRGGYYMNWGMEKRWPKKADVQDLLPEVDADFDALAYQIAYYLPPYLDDDSSPFGFKIPASEKPATREDTADAVFCLLDSIAKVAGKLGIEIFRGADGVWELVVIPDPGTEQVEE